MGIFLLACASSALNHFQERYTDALMDRTKERPIPAGKIKARTVIVIFFSLLMAGSLLLIFKTNLLTFIIGLLTLVWYNAVYTPLKRISPLAVIPGSLVGALPPIAGWAAAGGYIFDGRILIIASYFFVWQIPHFWFLLMIYGKDYEKGGFPTLTSLLSSDQLKRITFIWTVTTVLFALLIPLFAIINYHITTLILILLSVVMIIYSINFLKATTEKKLITGIFIRLNLFTLLLITILSADKIFKIL